MTEEYTVNLGSRSVNILVFDTGLWKKGKTVLVTAGMDGDEYAGIEAATGLIGLYRNKRTNGRLIIIPLINVPGHEIGHSRNPLDGLYPKRIFPGNPHGRPTERLVWWLYVNYVINSDIWIDLHSGATEEIITPCILSYETGVRKIDALSLNIVNNLEAENIVFEKNHRWHKVEKLSETGKSYMIFESGSGGKTDPVDVERHVKWVQTVLSVAGITRKLNVFSESGKNPKLWRKLTDYLFPFDCIWHPEIIPGQKVLIGTILGKVVGLFNKKEITVISRTAGTVLWSKRNCQAAAFDTLLTVASEKVAVNEIILSG